MEIPILILSHKRAGRVTTHRHVAGARVLVPESQAAAYARHHPPGQIVTHPDSVVGLPAKRQWVLERYPSNFQLDDDCIGLYRVWRYRGAPVTAIAPPEVAAEVIQNAADTARQLEAYFFGFASHANPLTYREHRPFRFGGYSPAGAIGFLAGHRLWFPRDCTLPMDDYWVCLLNAYHHRYAWFDGRFAFGFKDTYTGRGGMAEFRAGGGEEGATALLKRYFGAAVVPKRLSKTATKQERNPSARSIALPWTY